MTDLKETLYGIARAIVDNPDEVSVIENEDGKDVKLILSVAESDMGMVIGKGGKIAKAIRTVMKAAAATDGRRVNVEIRE
ncbi:MAG: KH domain-containing protein [Ruminococcaceae bacterium]|nr:KH domain-containing protein [Oscillospiraceae bacterium]